MVLLPAAVPASAQTPAERAREIATALQGSRCTSIPRTRAACREPACGRAAKATALGVSGVLDRAAADPGRRVPGQGAERAHAGDRRAAQTRPVRRRERRQRFPWTEVNELPQVERGQGCVTARQRALDDTEYDAGPTEVLARMYELLAGPSLKAAGRSPSPRAAGPRSGTTRRSATVATIVVAWIVGARRPGAGDRSGLGAVAVWFCWCWSDAAREDVQHSAARGRDRGCRATATADTRDPPELTTLGSELAALPTPAGSGCGISRPHSTRTTPPARFWTRPRTWSMSSARWCCWTRPARVRRRAGAWRPTAPVADVPELCAFNPLHGRASGQPTQVEADGATVTLPLCAECRRALKRGTAPASLPGDDGPYWHGDRPVGAHLLRCTRRGPAGGRCPG